MYVTTWLNLSLNLAERSQSQKAMYYCVIPLIQHAREDKTTHGEQTGGRAWRRVSMCKDSMKEFSEVTELACI